MIVYHGSTVRIDVPEIRVPNRPLDFGVGFYTTSDFDQAKTWALKKRRYEKSVVAKVNIYELDDAKVSTLKTREFAVPNKEWLDFVSENRLETYAGERFDLVIGPVANDTTMNVVSQYINSPREEADFIVAVRDIKAENLTDQYTFCTEEALTTLAFKEVVEVDS
jgi:hypothetical protein